MKSKAHRGCCFELTKDHYVTKLNELALSEFQPSGFMYGWVCFHDQVVCETNKDFCRG